MAKIKTLAVEGVPVVVLTADTLIQLVERINRLELKVKELENADQENFDNLVEHVGTVVAGGLKLKVFPGDPDEDGYRDVVVPIVSNEKHED